MTVIRSGKQIHNAALRLCAKPAISPYGEACPVCGTWVRELQQGGPIRCALLRPGQPELPRDSSAGGTGVPSQARRASENKKIMVNRERNAGDYVALQKLPQRTKG